MAIFSARLWWVVAAVLLASTNTQARNVTHEDIRDAMMSLVHMFRISEDKLERHEYREKALGEQLKKMILGLEKKHRNLESMKGTISRLDDRLYNVENIFLQEEREKETQKKTNEALDEIKKSLQTLTAVVTTNLKPAPPAELDNSLNPSGDPLSSRLDATDAKLDSIKKEVEALKNSLSKDALRNMCLDVAIEMNPFERHISEAEKLLNKYDMKLNELNGNSTKVQTDFVPLSEVALADEAWHSKMTEVMERQEKSINKIQKLLSDAESMWKDLPRLADLQRSSNYTLEGLRDLQANLTGNQDKAVTKINLKLREMGDRLVATNEDIQQSLTQGNTMSERAYNDIQTSYESLRSEVQAFSKNEHVMQQTADSVLATKKRLEYGVQQITLIMIQSSQLNKTINDRLNSLESQIVTNQTYALSNLTAKIESEMSQVWRQIGIVYQQLTASRTALDGLTEQTARYVNGSTTTLDNMKKNVGSITARMLEVDDNLNYLLGRLSLVTQEFGQIKTGLGDALEKAKTSFHDVQTKLEVVVVCCCFRFRIPRTKQQIEADYKRRKITSKFRQQLETIQDSKMDAISLKDALELLHEKSQSMEGENQQGSQHSSMVSPQQSSLEASFQPDGGQKPEPQASGLNFVKFATKVANLSKLGQPKSPTSPTTSDNKMDF
ncbi:putative leucine-rich repeat-containing protein DDB_G0290503 isoform X2 [Maniola hyperantus]|uniref:putative leucine-rich repeat-containing protein DDB_G0290503 isoform X2 n=1 Tax=Aphantopus hyperantus TaxID=2795564 RepID=UPI0037483849